MNDSDRWVNHNLQRQRELLERQRQRRLQASLSSAVSRTTNGIVMTANNSNEKQQQQQSATATKTTADNNNNNANVPIHRSVSNVFTTPQSNAQQQQHYNNENNSASASTATTSASSSSFEPLSSSASAATTAATAAVAERPIQSRGSLYSFLGGGAASTTTTTNNTNSTSSSTVHQQQRQQTSYQYSVFGEPKIITVKGITPPESRRQSFAEEDDHHHSSNVQRQGSSELRKPVLNVERLEPMRSSFCSEEADDEEQQQQHRGLRALSIHGNAGNGGSGGLSPQRSLSSTTALASSKRASFNGGELDDHDDGSSIPTEILNEEPLVTLDAAENLEQFVMDPVRKNYTLKCRISRDRRGMDRGMFPIYYLHMEKNDGRRTFLLAARKRKKSTTANYLISIDPTDMRRNGQSFIAKVRSNAMGTMFTIYDNGESPKRSSAVGDCVRRELGAIIYEANVLGLKGPRKMTIIIPGIYVDPKHNFVRPLAVRPVSEKDSILERFKTNRLDEMVVLNNKQPVWNEDTQSYVLNFHGRVTQASVKNFQIVHSLQAQSYDRAGVEQRNLLAPDPNEYIIMQFGRIDADTFTMDVRYPLSPVQAFGIVMSSFHGKLACE